MSSVVLLSGGLDSTVCVALANQEGGQAPELVTLTFDYGQRHRVELAHAAAIAAFYRADALVVSIDTSAWGGSALTDPTIDVPAPESAPEGIPVTYVPARNLIFLSVAMGVAEARGSDDVWIGVNSLDYSGYPDCRPEFIAAFAATAGIALRRGIEGDPVAIRTPLSDLTKAEIIRLGIEAGAPLQLTWSCYRGGQRPCGACDACHLRAKGFAEVGVADPALGG